TLANEMRDAWDQLSQRLRDRLTEGRTVSFDEYMSMRQHVHTANAALQGVFDDFDLILYPAAAGEADSGLESAGAARFVALCTMLHVPSQPYPIDVGVNGLSLGLQFI